MAAKGSKVSRAITYRRCVISPKPAQDLQQLICAALVNHPKPGSRFQGLNVQATELRVIGAHRTVSSCLCGFLTTFERGAAQPVIADDVNATSLPLSAIAPPPPKQGSAQQQYVPGVLYFVVFGNHVALVQSSSMRATAFESHVNWLLKDCAKLLSATDAFALSDEAQKATKAKIKKSHVKAISLGQPLMQEVAQENRQTAVAVVGAKSIQPLPDKAPAKFRPAGPMLDLIKNYFNNEEAFEKLGLDEVFDGNLEVWIEIRYPKRKRSQPEDAMQLMDALGMALRDIEGDQVSLELANGHKVSGSELKIAGNIDTSLLSNSLPDQAKLFDAMIAWLTAQIKNGVVDP